MRVRVPIRYTKEPYPSEIRDFYPKGALVMTPQYSDKPNATIISYFPTGALVLVDDQERALIFDYKEIRFLKRITDDELVRELKAIFDDSVPK